MSAGGRTTRDVAAFGSVSDCSTATRLYHRRVDTKTVLAGTEYEINYLQSRLAMKRGNIFEAVLRDNHHERLLDVIRAGLGIDVDAARVFDQSDIERDRDARVSATFRVLEEALFGPDGAVATIIDGAQLMNTNPDGTTSYYEADDLIVGPDMVVRVQENKSWPVLDGKPVDAKLCGSAVDQAAIYVVLLRREFALRGWDARGAVVSDEVVLVNPRNVGFEPTLTLHPAKARLLKAEALLSLASVDEEVEEERPISRTALRVIEDISSGGLLPEEVVQRINLLIDAEGNAYDANSCTASCGLSNLCQQRAYDAGDVAVLGQRSTAIIPGVGTLDRVLQLASGDGPVEDEEDSAAMLRQAASLLEDYLQ